tara:strand:- start:533 stop:1291 length:759 start_codon:yes stop_codon:yes gene_type:complete
MTNKPYFEYKKSPIVISVIVAIINELPGLSATLRSLRDKCHYQVEVIIIYSDISIANNIKQILKYHKLNSTSKIEHLTKSTVYDAYNLGIKISSGTHLIFLGSYDLLLLDQIPLIEKNKSYVMRSFLPFRNKIHPLHVNKTMALVFNNCHQSIIYAKEDLVSNLFNSNYPILADFDVNIKLLLLRKFTFMMNVIAIHQDYTGLSKTIYDKKFWNDYPKILSSNGLNFLQKRFTLILKDLFNLAVKLKHNISS